MEGIAPTVGTGLVGGGAAGFTMGYGVKKVTNLIKIIAITFVGLQLFVLSVLENYGIITVNWDALNEAFSNGFAGVIDAFLWAGGAASPLIGMVTSFVPATGGMMAGFLVGWKRG